MSISVCIISNAVNQTLLQTIATYYDVVEEVCVGFNNLTDRSLIDIVIQQFPNIAIYELDWEGYGPTKNALQSLAANNWILSVDADEQADRHLRKALKNFAPGNINTVYSLKILHYLGDYPIKYGAWGRGKRYFVRLFHRTMVHWDKAAVHESLVIPAGFQHNILPGLIQHKTAENADHLMKKSIQYAHLGALKKKHEGKRTYMMKPYLAAVFLFIKEYILLLGCMDGRQGFIIARSNAYYTYLKYELLLQMQDEAT